MAVNAAVVVKVAGMEGAERAGARAVVVREVVMVEEEMAEELVEGMVAVETVGVPEVLEAKAAAN